MGTPMVSATRKTVVNVENALNPKNLNINNKTDAIIFYLLSIAVTAKLCQPTAIGSGLPRINYKPRYT